MLDKAKDQLKSLETPEEKMLYLKKYYAKFWWDVINDGLLHIQTKSGAIIKLYPNPTQKRLLALIIKLWKENKPIRILIPKARQLGVSTLIEAIIMSIVGFAGQKKALIIADEGKKSTNIFNMSKLMYDRMNEAVKPEKKESNAKVLAFDKIDSRIDIDTAENRDAGRSGNWQIAHLCLDENQKILIEHGRTKKIKDVNIGDKVITHNGHTAKVSGISSKMYKDKMLEIKLQYHTIPLILTKEHKVYTQNGFIEAGKLKKGDMVSFPIRRLDESVSEIKVSDYPQSRKGRKMKPLGSINLTEDFGYLVGYYLAEGCVTYQTTTGRANNIVFTYDQDETFIDRVDDYMLREHNKLPTIINCKASRSKQSYFCNSVFTTAIKELFGSADDKHIPDWVFSAKKEFILGLIQGYFHGDGSKGIAKKQNYESSSISVTSIRESLIYQIRDLLLSLGYGFGSVRYKKKGMRYGRNCQNAWVYHINGTGANKLRKLLGYEQTKTSIEKQRQGTRYTIKDDKVWFPIKNIRQVVGRNVIDLEINHKDHSFRTNVCSVSNSEIDYYPDAEYLMSGLSSCIAKLPRTMVFMESTGNGVGSYFHTMIQKSMRGENEYETFFIPWFDNPEYSTPLNPDEVITIGSTGKYGNEKYYYENFNLTLEQIKWRRTTIRNDFNYNLRKFAQEYPTTVDEAFIASGQPVFDRELLEEIAKGYTREFDISAMVVNDKLIKTSNGYIKIWNKPKYDLYNRYVVWADTGGVWYENDKNCADYSFAVVYDRVERKIVCTVHGHFEAMQYARILVAIAKYYDDAKLAIEINKYASETDEQGVSVLDNIKEKIKYHNFYTREVYDDQIKKNTTKIGFHTNRDTKQMIVNRLYAYVHNFKEEDIFVNDEEIINEMRTYVITQTKTGKTSWNAQEGYKDDRVVAFGGALVVSDQMPAPRSKHIENEYEDDSDEGLL